MKNKKVLRLLVALCVMGTVVTGNVFAAPSSEEAQKKVDSLEEKKKATESQVTSLQSQLKELLSKIDDLQAEMVEKQDEITEVTADLEAAKEREAQQYDDMKIRIKYMYEEGGSIEELEKVFKSKSIADMLNQAEYVQNLHTYDRQKLTEYVETKEEVADLKDSLEKQMSELQDLQKSYQAQSDDLNDTIVAKSAEVENFSEQLQAAAKEVVEAKEREEAEKAAEAARVVAANRNTTNNPAPAQNSISQPSTPEAAPAAPSNSDSSFTGSGVGEIVVAAAYSQLGVPYVWGGNDPGVGLDCSGLTKYCYAQAGITIPRTDITQLNAGRIVSDPQPGDICWTPGHVAIYIGNGQMIEAQQPGTTICISSVRATYYVRF